MPTAYSDPIALTQALVRCPSVTPLEAGALDFLEQVLTGAGFTCHRMTFSDSDTPDVENLYARIGSASPNLCFAGHTDVVPPGDTSAWTSDPFAAEVKGDILYGRGTVDMKGGIACFLAASLDYLDACGGEGPPASLSFLITGDEEGPSINGTAKVLQWLEERGEKLDACVVGEPSNPQRLGDEIKIGRRGSLNGELVVKGVQGHAAYPAKADNPIPKLARMIDRLAQTPIDTGSDAFEASQLQVTIVSVPNTATNVIPGRAHATFNIRYNDLWNRQKIEAWVRDICEKEASDIGADYELEMSGTGDVFLTKPGPLVETMSQAVETVTGRTPALSTGGGTSDARFIKDACPVIEFGLVNETIHQVDEHVPVCDLVELKKIYKLFIEKYFAAVAR